MTVAAPASDCNPRYGVNARIQVSVTDKSGTEVISATAPMTDAGEFTYTFTVPAEIAAGEATVTAMPHNIDWCDDTGRNNRAEGAESFELASCATPVEALIITRWPRQSSAREREPLEQLFSREGWHSWAIFRRGCGLWRR